MTTPQLPRLGGPLVAFGPRQEFLDEFAASLVGLTYDDITVLGAIATFGSWSSDDNVEVQLRISGPPAGRETWPVASLHEIRMEVRRRAYEAGIDQFLDVSTTGGPDDDLDDEPERPPGPSRARIRTFEERSEQL
jgi:hypothetical protein